MDTTSLIIFNHNYGGHNKNDLGDDHRDYNHGDGDDYTNALEDID